MSNLIKNYLYNIVSLLTGALFPFVIFPYISRILMPEYLGKIAFAQAITNYFIILALVGIPVYGIRELSKAKVSKQENDFFKTFTELLIISLVTSIMSFTVFLCLIILNKKLIDIKYLLYIYICQVIFSFLNLDYFFIALEKHKRRTIRTLILRVVSIVLIFFIVKKPGDYIKYGAILVFPELLARMIDLYIYKNYIYLNFEELNFKKHLKPLLIIFLYVFSAGIYVNLDAMMLGFMKTEVEVGLYTTGSKLVKMIVPLLSILGTVMTPRIIEYIKSSDKKKIYEIMDYFIDFNFILSIPITILMIFLSKDIILLISGIKFIGSNLTLKIMSIILVIIPLTNFFGAQILLPNDKENSIFKISLLGMFCNVFFNFLLIPKLGIEGAAIATVATEILVCISRSYEVKKIYCDYNFITKERKNYLASGLVSIVILWILKNTLQLNTKYNLVFFSSIYMSVYLILLILRKDKNIYIFFESIKKIKRNKENIL